MNQRQRIIRKAQANDADKGGIMLTMGGVSYAAAQHGRKLRKVGETVRPHGTKEPQMSVGGVTLVRVSPRAYRIRKHAKKFKH